MPDQEVEEILDEETGDGHLMVRTARRDLPASWGARNQKYRARLARAPARASRLKAREGRTRPRPRAGALLALRRDAASAGCPALPETRDPTLASARPYPHMDLLRAAPHAPASRRAPAPQPTFSPRTL